MAQIGTPLDPSGPFAPRGPSWTPRPWTLDPWTLGPWVGPCGPLWARLGPSGPLWAPLDPWTPGHLDLWNPGPRTPDSWIPRALDHQWTPEPLDPDPQGPLTPKEPTQQKNAIKEKE